MYLAFVFCRFLKGFLTPARTQDVVAASDEESRNRIQYGAVVCWRLSRWENGPKMSCSKMTQMGAARYISSTQEACRVNWGHQRERDQLRLPSPSPRAHVARNMLLRYCALRAWAVADTLKFYESKANGEQ